MLPRSGPHDSENRRAAGSALQRKEDVMRARVRGHRVRVVARMLFVDLHQAWLVDVEDGESAALGRHVDPAKSWIDRHDIGAAAGLCRDDGVCVTEVDPRQDRVALACNEGALAVGVQAKTMSALATWEVDLRLDGGPD